jgi:transposase InsO family protein
VDQRQQLVDAIESGLYGMSELCRELGISRKTGYKWLRRYEMEGAGGLEDRSRVPRRCPHRTDGGCEERLVDARRRHPHWGPRKLLKILADRDPEVSWPAASTASRILKRHGLVVPRRRRARKETPGKPNLEATQPNDVWTADFKGEFRLGNRELCYPLTVADMASRYLLRCEVKRSTASAPVRQSFEELFARYGRPAKILTDSGTPFGAPHAIRRWSQLSVWWIRLGIEPVLIQPGHPEQNGCHERMHRTLKQATTRPPGGNLAQQQRRFDEFCCEYNDLRPHESLGMRTPGSVYQPSTRHHTATVPDMTYPGHYEVRRVRRSGEINWRGCRLFLSEVLAGTSIGMEEVDDRRWSIYFGPILIGRFDESTNHLDRL